MEWEVESETFHLSVEEDGKTLKVLMMMMFFCYLLLLLSVDYRCVVF